MPSAESRVPDVRTIATTTHGRYLVVPPVGDGPAPLLVGFHGYGESAEAWLDQALRLPVAREWLVVSVQALHRFYNTKAQTTVASWMTRQDRQLLIADNVAYVDQVVAAVTRDFGTVTGPVYAGFSQGVAMAYRAAAFGRHPARGVIALAGDVPPDVVESDDLTLPGVLIGCGARDDWYRAEALEVDVARLRARGVEVEAVVFEGGHEWGRPFMDAANRMLERLARTGSDSARPGH
jgi:predicted esterase